MIMCFVLLEVVLWFSVGTCVAQCLLETDVGCSTKVDGSENWAHMAPHLLHSICMQCSWNRHDICQKNFFGKSVCWNHRPLQTFVTCTTGSTCVKIFSFALKSYIERKECQFLFAILWILCKYQISGMGHSNLNTGCLENYMGHWPR